jgi:PadR family transcriptional regulator, regulatory protein PadR
MARAHLTDLELMILLAVMRIGDEAYGVTITREIEATAGRGLAVAVVYATLDRLEDRGFVSSAVGDPTPERGGRAKRFFRVTAKGVRQARDTQRALSALWDGVPEFRGGEA